MTNQANVGIEIVCYFVASLCFPKIEKTYWLDLSLCASSKPGQISEDAFIVIPTSVIHTMPWLVCFRFPEPLVSGPILDWVDTSPGLSVWPKFNAHSTSLTSLKHFDPLKYF